MTLVELLAPYSRAKVARMMGVSPGAVDAWAQGRSIPSADKLPPLADLLRVDLADLTRIVAEDTKRRNAASDSRTQGAA